VATKKQYIADAELFCNEIIGGFHKYIDNFMGERTEEWKKRGQGNVIRSSTFGTCSRLAWYTYKSNSKITPSVFDRKTTERMLMGFIGEANFLKVMDIMPMQEVTEKNHMAQNEEPVHIRIEVEGIEYAATTDVVKEIVLDGESYYFPIEIKHTELREWENFSGHWFHKDKLLAWIHIAKLKGWNVPFGALTYVWKFFNWWVAHEVRPIIFSVDSKFMKLSRYIEDYDKLRPYIADRMEVLNRCIKEDELPPRPKELVNHPTAPSKDHYLCKDCAFRSYCDDNRKLDVKKGN